MGSGAGFPGLVIAIQLADVAGAAVHLIESDRRKCAFLREAVRITGAAASVHSQRVEAVEHASLGPVDAVTARAFAPLPLTLKLARPWIDRGAVGVFPRGEFELETKSRRCRRRLLMKSKSFRASSTQGQRSSEFAKAEKQGP